jgi:hypothetical protein
MIPATMKPRDFAIVLLFCAASFAQTSQPAESLSVLKGRPDAQGDELLGPTYESRGSGISFRAPADSKQIKKAYSGEEIAEFAVEAKNWRLTVVRSTVKQPLPLTGAETNTKGLLELTVDRLKQNSAGADVVRQDTVDIGDSRVGMIAARFTIGTSRVLCQEAIFQANDQLYYTLSLVSPAAKTNAEGKTPDDDPAEHDAVETFRHVIDTVKLLDRTMVKEDQNQRLFRTRALFVNWNEATLKAALIPDFWLRLIKDGKDIGYTHVTEQMEKPDTSPGIYVRIRSYSSPTPGVEANALSWLFVTFDRRHEDWSSMLQMEDKTKNSKNVVSEVGSSNRKTARVLDQNIEPGEPGPAGKADAKQPPVRQTEVYTLTVTTKSRDFNSTPINRNLPPFYLPQALGHLLPRLVPIKEPKTFLFASYVADRREVMMRYVDVGYEQEIDLGGKHIRAVPVQERIGLEGDPTIHYISPEGKFLGSVSKESGLTILPAELAEIRAHWPNADEDHAALEAAH